MGRIVAIGGGDLESNQPIHKYILEMDRKDSHNFLFVGTASKDAEGYIDSIKMTFEPLGCCVKALCLSAREYTQEEIDECLQWADIIYVGGGDTFYMMEVWRKYSLDKKLKEVYLNDTAILTGISAGAMCWFDCGHSNSKIFWEDDNIGYGWVEQLLNMHPYVFCPHYEERVESFDKMIMDKSVSGLALDADTAFVEVNGSITYIKCKEASKVYLFRHENGTVVKEELEAEMVASTNSQP